MTIQTVPGWDVMGSQLHLVPGSAGAYGGGYITGSGGVPWNAAQIAEYPQAVLYDQSPTITTLDERADAYDLENGAVTTNEIAQLVKAGQAAFNAVSRPGQRWPAVYMSASNVTSVVNALIAGGVSACPLIVADYNYNEATANSAVANASGPFPIVGYQYSDKGGGGVYDLDVWSLPWLNNRSHTTQPPKPQVPPGQWNNPNAWSWKAAHITGTGENGLAYTFNYNPATGAWAKA